jgi:hypothetical protein
MACEVIDLASVNKTVYDSMNSKPELKENSIKSCL